MTQKNDNPDPKKLERLWIEPRNMFMTLKKQTKKVKKREFGEEYGTSTARSRGVFLEVLELLQDPLRSH